MDVAVMKQAGFLTSSILRVVAASLALTYPMLFAQSNAAAGGVSVHPTNASPVLSFDVAPIKPIEPGGGPVQGWAGDKPRPDGVEFSFRTLSELLCYAYGYEELRFDGQIAGLPEWALNQRYDVVAKMSDADTAEFQKLGSAKQQQTREAMMQSLLAERFHLVLHRGSKQLPVYEIVVAKGGIKMKDAETDPNPPFGRGEDGKPVFDLRWREKTSIMQAFSMDFLARVLSMPEAFVGRPVLDKTGLTGAYDFTLNWSYASASAAARSGAADGDSTSDLTTIFTALEEIGLKLQPSTASMETIVIDHVEEPSPN
jgi:uncharacterized protein (TIGR03435 family)